MALSFRECAKLISRYSKTVEIQNSIVLAHFCFLNGLKVANIFFTFLSEHSEGKDSFYFPYLDCISPECTTLLTWTPEEIAELDDPILQKQLKELARDTESSWKTMKAIYDKYPELYPPDKYL